MYVRELSTEEKKTGNDYLIFCAIQEPSVATMNSATASSKEPKSSALITMCNFHSKRCYRGQKYKSQSHGHKFVAGNHDCWK